MKTFHRCGRGLLLAPLLLAAAACQTPEIALPPPELMPREKLVPLLADLHQLEAQVESSHLSPDSARALYLAQQKAILWRYEVTDSVFKRSYRYYGIHGKDMNEIYQSVVDTLTNRETKFSRPAGAAQPPAQWGNEAK